MITIIKLNNGLEIVGLKEYENNDLLVLNRPLQINYRYFVGPSPSVSFVRYIMFGDSDNITFDKTHIVSSVSARQTFVDVYEHHASYYYGEHSKIIDSELQLHKKTSDDENMKNFLDSLSIEGASVN
jgi:hypothetical protein